MKVYDLIGVGIGPSNLSTAALLYPKRDELDYLFLDDKELFQWHPGMLFPNATIQVSILKDLVTMVAPDNPFSFLNFLKQTGRLYMFASKGSFDGVKRKEFEQYFRWCASNIENLQFSTAVQSIECTDEGYYNIITNKGDYMSKNLVVGAGLTAKVPDFCRPFIGGEMFHSTQFLKSNIDLTNKKIVVVGGGQSGAEIVLQMLNNPRIAPDNVTWVSRSYNLLPMEDSPFSNELYTPIYSDYFYELKPEAKANLLQKQKITSDGISESTLNEIYETLYNNKFLLNKANLNLLVNTSLTGVERTANGDFTLTTLNNHEEQDVQELNADIVILATGLEYKVPTFLKPILSGLSLKDGKFEVNKDYSIKSVNNDGGKVFLHNGSRHVRGVADPNLSLLAWRSAKIINALMQDEIYNTTNDHSIIDWI